LHFNSLLEYICGVYIYKKKGAEYMTIGENIRKHRKELNLTQIKLAEMLGVSTLAIKNWESGSYTPTIRNMKELAKIFGISLGELCDPEKKPIPEPVKETKPDLALSAGSDKIQIIEEIMKMDDESFSHLVKYFEFLKKEKSGRG